MKRKLKYADKFKLEPLLPFTANSPDMIKDKDLY